MHTDHQSTRALQVTFQRTKLSSADKLMKMGWNVHKPLDFSYEFSFSYCSWIMSEKNCAISMNQDFFIDETGQALTILFLYY